MQGALRHLSREIRCGERPDTQGGGEGMTGVADRRAERVVSAGIVGESLAQSTMLRPRTDQRTGSEPA